MRVFRIAICLSREPFSRKRINYQSIHASKDSQFINVQDKRLIEQPGFHLGRVRKNFSERGGRLLFLRNYTSHNE